MLRFAPMEDAQPPPPKKRKWLRRLTALTVLLALLGGLLWSGWYVYNRGFTRKWRAQLAAELRRRGLDFSARRLTLNPFEGLTAENVRIYLLDEQHTQLIYVDKVAVDIDLVAFIRHKPFLNSLDLRGARLTLPVDMASPQGARKLKLRRLSAKIDFLPDEVRVSQADGEFYGLQLSASGSLLHPQSFSTGTGTASEEEAARRRQWVRNFIDELEKIEPEHAPPRLEVRFQGDLAQPGSLRASALLQGESLRRGSCRVARLLARMDYSAGAFHLQQGELADDHGSLAAQGDFNPDTAEAHFQVQSSLDLLTFAREFLDPKLFADLRLYDTPRLQLEGRTRFGTGPAARRSANPGSRIAATTATAAPLAVQTASNEPAAPPPPPALQLTGRLALGRFAYRDFEFERAETEFSWSGERWYMRGLRVVRPGGGNNAVPQTLTADALSEPGACRLRLTSTFDPVPFLALLPAREQALLNRLEFHDPPRIDLTAAGPSFTDAATLHAEGKVALGRTRYRGTGINSLKMDVAFADGVLSARHVNLERDEGTATGDLVTYNLAKHEMRLDNVRSGLDLSQVGVWLDPDVYHTIQPFRFRRPPTLVMNGNLQFEGGRNSHLVTNVEAPGGMDYVFIKKTLPFKDIAGQVVFNEERMWLNDVHGEIFNGQARGSLNLALGGKGSTHEYSATLDFKDLDFARLTKLYFDYDTSKGQLSGRYDFSGKGTDERSLRGTGAVSVERGDVFSIPFLGPLSPIINAVLPGLGFDHAHQASANFQTHGGKIFTGDMDVKGLGFSLFGAGWMGYADDTMNFRVRLNARGLPGAVLRPMSDLFEYASTGPLSKPVWRPKVLTSAPPVTEEKKPEPTPAAKSK